MKAFIISSFLCLLATKLHATPTSNARQFQAQLTFEGAPPAAAFYTLSVPTDGSLFTICTQRALSPNFSPCPNINVLSHLLVSRICMYLTSTITADPLSVSHISSEGGASCTLFGIDGSTTTVVCANTVDVGPPQTQVSGSCLAL